MSEFPREDLTLMATTAPNPIFEAIIRRAIKAYDDLSDRLVRDTAAHRVAMGQKDEAIANLHFLLDLSPVAADYDTRLAALHRVRDLAIQHGTSGHQQ